MGDVGKEQRKVGSVTYQEVGEEYFAQRKLRRHAGVWSLWALGVGAVISGDFYGWNFGLSTAGFGGLLIATVIIAIMYYGLCYSIAEMSPALPHTGGAYSFARSAMGPWGGFLTGLAENMEYVITPAVVVGAMGLLMQALVIDIFNVTGDPWWNSEPFWWAVFYVIFVGINVIGIEATMRFTVVITVLALGVLAIFYVSALVSGDFDPDLWFNIPKDWDGETTSACWPTAEDRSSPWGSAASSRRCRSRSGSTWRSRRSRSRPRNRWIRRRDVPKGTIWGMHTLVITGALILLLNSGVDGGAGVIGISGTPLFDGFIGDLRRGVRRRDPRALRPDRPDRELLHDHLRVRPEHVLAVAGRVLPEVLVGDARETQHPARGAHRRSRRRLPGCAPGLVPQPAGRNGGRAGRRRPALHGRVRRGDLVRDAVPVVHPAPPQAAEHQSSLPQQVGGPRRSHRRDHRASSRSSRCSRTTITDPASTGWPPTTSSA